VRVRERIYLYIKRGGGVRVRERIYQYIKRGGRSESEGEDLPIYTENGRVRVRERIYLYIKGEGEGVVRMGKLLRQNQGYFRKLGGIDKCLGGCRLSTGVVFLHPPRGGGKISLPRTPSPSYIEKYLYMKVIYKQTNEKEREREKGGGGWNRGGI